MSPELGKPTPSACSILIVSSQLLDLNPELAIQMDQSMKNHVWIINGKYDKPRILSWPVLEVQPMIVKLHCPGGSQPQLVLPSMPVTCPEYPTWNNKVVRPVQNTFKKHLDTDNFRCFPKNVQILSEKKYQGTYYRYFLDTSHECI